MANTRITRGVIKPNENYDTHNIKSTGIITAIGLDISGNASIGGVLTYEDVTSIDSVGVITARSGIDVDDFLTVGNNIQLGNAGIITATGADIDDFLDVGSNIKLGNAGVITATSFSGSGANLTGIDATSIKDSAGNIKVQALPSGAVYTGIHTFNSGAEVGSNIKLGNAGVVTATSFVGDASSLINLPAGIGTALNGNPSHPLNNIYYTNTVLPINSTVTVDPPASASAAYTQYTDISVGDGADLIISDGDDLIPDILGLRPDGTFGGGTSLGRLRVDKIVGKDANSAVNFEKGIVVAGVTTTTTLNVTGNVSIGGTLTYEDVINIDSVGIITARKGIVSSGVVTATSFVGSGAQLTGIVGGKFGGGATGIQTVGNVGVQTADMTSANLVGAASSLVGLYIGDGSLLFSNNLSRSGGYYITTGVNALNAGPVSLNTTMTLDGTWVIV